MEMEVDFAAEKEQMSDSEKALQAKCEEMWEKLYEVLYNTNNTLRRNNNYTGIHTSSNIQA
jgi:hypothetical protein